MSGRQNPFDNQMDRHTCMNHECSHINRGTLEHQLLLPVGIHPHLQQLNKCVLLKDMILPDNYNQNISTEI